MKRKNELSSTYTGLDRKTQQRIIIKHSTHDEQYENSGIKIERLIVESDVLRSLKHPSIVKYVHSWGNKKDYYLITEYVDAKNMKETCENNAPPRDLTIEYILQLLEVAEYLHDKGIIHRDIKPSNIILSDTIILLDFNAAEAKRLNFEHNRIIIGTPGYQSPESYKGIESPQCDVYSVGATLLFLLTGEHPSGDLSHFKTLSQHKDLLEIALKAMNPDPLIRFKTAFEMRQRLQSLEKNQTKLVTGNNHYRITKDTTTIGRNDYADFKIPDQHHYVSPLHAEIRKFNGKYYIFNNSINGTYIYQNEKYIKIEKWLLSDGDTIALCYNSAKGPYRIMTFRNTR